MSLLDDIINIAGEVSNICGIVAEHKTSQINSIKKELMRFMILWTFLISAIVLMMAGFLFICWGVYLFIAEALNRGWAAVIVGGAIILIGAILFISLKMCRGADMS
ncbi:MAG: phage holin family protein [Sedimentisphaerales bacterium]|jgi:membrane-bound ClpP family serine protease